MSEEEKPQEIVLVLRKSSTAPNNLTGSVSGDGEFLFIEEGPNELNILDKIKTRFFSRNLGVNRVSWKTEKRQ